MRGFGESYAGLSGGAKNMYSGSHFVLIVSCVAVELVLGG